MLLTITIFLETAASVVTLAGSYLLLSEYWRGKKLAHLFSGLIFLLITLDITFVYLAQILANLDRPDWALALFKVFMIGLLAVLFLSWLFLIEYFSLPRRRLAWASILLALLGCFFSARIGAEPIQLRYFGNITVPGFGLSLLPPLFLYSFLVLILIGLITIGQLRTGQVRARLKSIKILLSSLIFLAMTIGAIYLFVITQQLFFYWINWVFVFLVIVTHFLGSYLPPDSPFFDHPLDFFRSKIMFKLVFYYTFLIIISIGLITAATIYQNKKILAGQAAAVIKQLETNYMIFAVLGIMATFLIGVILAWTIIRPIKKIVAAVNHITSGNLDHQVKIDGYDEIDQLAGDFNLMTKNLKSARTKIEDWNRQLEAEVTARTRELVQSNEQLRLAYQKLEQTQAQLVQAAKLAAMGELVSGLTHDINNPLASIVIHIDLLQLNLKNSDKTVAESLAELKRQSQHLQQVSHNFLSFIRRTEPVFRPVDLAEAVTNSRRLINYQLLQKKINFVFEPAPGLPRILGEPSQFQQVLINLLTNAIYALPEGGRLTVSARPVQDRQKVEIKVADNGSGIAPENLGKIFESFFTTKPLEEGTGLGLSICQGIIKKHNGEIRVDSQPGRGTTFTIILPAVEVA